MSPRYLDERTYDTGDIVFAEGDPGSEMFIVAEGRVVITKEVAGQKVFLATQERGDVFGEMSLLTSQPRHSTCVATAPTRLVAIKSGELLMKLRRDPTFALEMLQQMSRRISYLEEQVSRLTEQELTSRQELARIVAKSTHRSE